MARHLASTPPASRSATPNPPIVRSTSNAAAGPRRSSIVPFTRPGSSGTGGPEDGGTGSLKSGEEAVQRLGQSLQHLRRSSSGRRSSVEGSSLGEHGTPFGGLKRPERRTSASFARGNGFVRKEGFQTEAVGETRSEEQKLSPRPPVAPNGLLSRQFSSDSLQPALTRQQSSSDALKERLQKCYEKSPPAIGDAPHLDPALLLRTLQLSFPVFQTTVVTRAFNVAKAAHVGSSAPLVRCGEVARTLADLEASKECIAAALLHSVLDTSMLTELQLREVMSKEVADTVCNVHKLSGICQVHQDLVESQGHINESQHQQFLSMLLAMEDVPAVLIVLADRLQQLRSQPGDKTAAREALDVFAPLANRLGVWSIKAELEDLAFKALQPVEYAELQAKCEESQKRGTIEANLDQLKGRLAAKGVAGDLSGRPKNLWGVYSKMRAKGYGLDKVYDVRALRVVVDSKSDCYEVLREVHTLWTPVDGRFKDYIRNKKANGYQSLHTVVLGADGVPMEVQIRTQKMHWIAEYGVAAHWRYKETVKEDFAHERHIAWSRYLISFQMELADKKCRPSGSPPRDSGLAALNTRICAFPQHNTNCKFTDYFCRQHMAPQPPTSADASSAPVYVVVFDSRSQRSDGSAHCSIEQLPGGFTAGQLAQRLVAGSPARNNTHLRMLVNHKEVTGPQQLLEQCDHVEIFESSYVEGDPLHLGIGDLEQSRQLLQRMFSRSGSLSGDLTHLGFHYGQPVPQT